MCKSLNKQPQSPAIVHSPGEVITTLVFTDTKQHWARADIEKMAALGLISGVAPGIFEPDRNITRAEFSAILLRTLGIEPQSHVTGRFADVLAGEWYFDTINTAASLGLVNGYSASSFAPQEPITREQMAVMIYTALRYQAKDVTETESTESGSVLFADAHLISPWAEVAVASAAKLGLIKGRGNNIFAPQENATRAEASVLLLKLREN